MKTLHYYIAVRRDPKIGFVLIARTDEHYVGEPKKFDQEELLHAYARFVVECGRENVAVSEAKYFFLTGHVEEVSDEYDLPPWMKAGHFVYEKKPQQTKK